MPSLFVLSQGRYTAGVLVLAATNRPQAIDAAVLRPGRFDALLFVPPPDSAGRLETLQIHTRSIPLHADVDLQACSCLLMLLSLLPCRLNCRKQEQ